MGHFRDSFLNQCSGVELSCSYIALPNLSLIIIYPRIDPSNRGRRCPRGPGWRNGYHSICAVWLSGRLVFDKSLKHLWLLQGPWLSGVLLLIQVFWLWIHIRFVIDGWMWVCIYFLAFVLVFCKMLYKYKHSNALILVTVTLVKSNYMHI